MVHVGPDSTLLQTQTRTQYQAHNRDTGFTPRQGRSSEEKVIFFLSSFLSWIWWIMEHIGTDIFLQTRTRTQSPCQGRSLPYDPALPIFTTLPEEDPKVQKATHEPAFLYDLNSFSTQELDLVICRMRKNVSHFFFAG